jgi:hypothetical protein
MACALWFCAPASAQVSPGPLSRAHAPLEGVTRCAMCHDFGAGKRSFKCLECHGEIQRRVQTHAGFHGRAYKSSSGQTDCARCHMEHNGEGFALIRLDRKGFDHLAQTGIQLEGKHRRQPCQSCHNEKRIPVPARAEIKEKDLSRSFLGLRQECAFCHQDQHRGQLGQQCTRCHTQEAWKPAQGFNHSSTHFPLTGLHQTVACQKCHGPKAGEERMQFSGLVFSSCQSCHSDPHRGGFREAGFRGSCDNCHNTSGWKTSHPSSSFNHNATKFPLTGKHAERACFDCHKGSDFHKPIAHDRCQDCHQDPHSGQFASRAAGSDCSACHFDTGFKPSRFDREAHRQSAFPLEGKHAQLECAKCHEPKARATVYMTGKRICSACHQDAHAGEFAAAPYANQCNLCHTADGFQPAAFSVARHAQTHFALTGQHVSVACNDCHKPLATASTLPPPRRHHFVAQTCNTCHVDPHQTKLACETCHTTAQWKEVSPYDHAKTGFRIEGAHEKLKCIDCHNPSGPGAVAASTAKPDFSQRPGTCSACHAKADVHGRQFSKGGREEDCSTCHSPLHWPPGDFNHERTRFPLDVAHRNVACAKCHKPEMQADGKIIRTYRDTPAGCVNCH